MAGVKSWLMKIKNRILRKKLDSDLLQSKIQIDDEKLKEKSKEKELPDLITPTNENIKISKNSKQNKIQREEAIGLKKVNKKQIAQSCEASGFDKGFVYLTNITKRTN